MFTSISMNLLRSALTRLLKDFLQTVFANLRELFVEDLIFCIPKVCQSIVEKLWRQPGEIVEIQADIRLRLSGNEKPPTWTGG